VLYEELLISPHFETYAILICGDQVLQGLCGPKQFFFVVAPVAPRLVEVMGVMMMVMMMTLVTAAAAVAAVAGRVTRARGPDPRPALQDDVDDAGEDDETAQDDDDGQFEFEQHVLVVPQKAVVRFRAGHRPWCVVVVGDGGVLHAAPTPTIFAKEVTTTAAVVWVVNDDVAVGVLGVIHHSVVRVTGVVPEERVQGRVGLLRLRHCHATMY
jgi:hypothetical protein